MNFDYGKTAAFTGHRSQKLPFGFNETLPSAQRLRSAIRAEIEYAVLCGYMFFLSGMALGTDMIAAEEVLSLKKERYPHIQLIAALPCRGQADGWLLSSRARYNDILRQCSKVVYVNDKPYFNGCMQARNRYLIDHSTLLIAVYDGKPGGTGSTVSMARKKGHAMVIIDPIEPVRVVPVDNDRQLDYFKKTENRCQRQLEYLRQNNPQFLDLLDRYTDPAADAIDRYKIGGRLYAIICDDPIFVEKAF